MIGSRKISTSVAFHPTTLDVIDIRRGGISRSEFIDTFFREFFADDLAILQR